jgi:sporulation protein YlmC with PRC-barrel domain
LSLFTENPRRGLLGFSEGQKAWKEPGLLDLGTPLGWDSPKLGFRYCFEPPKSGKATEKWLEREASMESGQQRSNLTKLSELDLPLEEPWQDMRELDVYDIADEQIGTVEDLYVYRESRLARYLIVSAGGFLGVGKKHFLIPVEEVSRDVGEDRVRVTQDREKVLNSPEFDPDVGVPDPAFQRAIEAYYGHG